MKRTQIYLPEDMWKELKDIAHNTNMTISELIREKLKHSLAKKEKLSNQKFFVHLETLARKYQTPKMPKDLAINHNKYIYGHGK